MRLRMQLLVQCGIFAILLSAGSTFCSTNSVETTISDKDSVANKLKDYSLRPFGYGDCEFGQIVRGQYTFARSGDGRLDHYCIERSIVQLGLELKHQNGLAVVLAGEGQVYFPYAGGGDGSGFGYELLEARYKWYPHQAEASYSLGSPGTPQLRVGVGFFPFKYNPDGRNFGDYLFRMSTYPQYMPTSFDSPYQRLFGLRAHGNIFSSLNLDALLTSEVYLWPLRDFSLTFLADYTLLDFADFGAGIMGHRMFSVDTKLTTPSFQDQNSHSFSFAGTKVMFRLSLDFKKILPGAALWGKNDWRLYGEACLNGLKNYKIDDTTDLYYPGYNDLMKRLPVLIGFNVPTCKVFDVLSVEVEWWDTYPFANSYWGVYPVGYKQNPFPERYDTRHKAFAYGGPWHWSIYAKKNILGYINLIAQVARDHTVLETTLTGTSNADPEEAMDGIGSWAWMGKIEYCF
jgi:hypothetical protein